MPGSPLIIQATPPLSPLPASDTESIYLVALAQLQCPGRWGLTTASWASNNGSLPYLTHLDHLVPASHLHSLPLLPHPDTDLDTSERAEALSWVAYIDGKVTDLINHTLYSLPPNYPATIAKAHASNLSFPQSIYIPQRLRSMYKARLQHVGLWGLGGMNDADLAVEDRKRLEEVYVQGPGGTVAPRAWSGWRSGKEFEDRRRKRGEEELAKKIREAVAILDRRLGSKPYFFSNRPTTPDLRLFANLSLVLEPSLPNALLPNLLKEEYPNLVSHYDRIKWLLFGPESWSIVKIIPPTIVESSWSDYLPSLPFFGNSQKNQVQNPEAKKVSKKELDFKRIRWLWYAGAVGAMVTYLIGSGLVSIDFGNEEGDEEEDEEGEIILEDTAKVIEVVVEE